MNIDSVRTLLLAVDLKSLSAAGERIGVPPSTVSRRVRDLEEDLGSTLLVRTGRGVKPTSEAAEILTKLRDLLAAADACYAPRAPLTRLKITATTEMGLSLLPDLIPAFRAKFPEVVVEVLGENRALGLIEQDFDLAIRTGVLDDSSYLSRRLPTGGFIAVATPAMAAKIRTLKQLGLSSTVDVAGPPPELSGRWKGKRFRTRSPAIAKLDTFSAALPLVLAGNAYAKMPFYLVRDHLSAGRLTTIASVELDPVPLHALFPRRHRGQAALVAFVDAVAEALVQDRVS